VNRAITTREVEHPTALETDGDVVARYLEDAAHYPGGVAFAVARPRSVNEVVWVIRRARTVLPVGAQSSLTGGATPAGDVVLSSERLDRLELGEESVTAGAGVTLHRLQEALAPHDRWFPPVPTFLGATVGGAVSTNAAGAATFKYGSVRRWVRGLTVVLSNGDVLRLTRGEVTAGPDGTFAIATSDGERHVRVPSIHMPDVAKCSAGYFAAPGMDLIDLFIGAEGTLGMIVAADLAIAKRPGGVCWMLIALQSEADGIALAGDFRDQRTLDVAAIEHIDRRSIDVLREDGVDRRLEITIARDTEVLLLVQLELGGNETAEGFADRSLQFLAKLLAKYGVLESAEIVLPADRRRAAAFVELRESVPAGVNRRVARAHAADTRVSKTAADMIVPFERFAEMMRECRARCGKHQLDLAVWGHISDGNVHPNVIPRDYKDVEEGRAVILELAARVIAMGGSPLAEHGVGRNPTKQQLLRMMYGESGIRQMREVKLGLDPDWKLAPGLLFERSPAQHSSGDMTSTAGNDAG
jgi:D-lactate dehydrogenase (cytochrome)